jgi:hypothetical protein
LANGTSNIGIPVSNGNANISIGGVSNVLVASTTGISVTGAVTATGNVSVVGNVTGGNVIS